MAVRDIADQAQAAEVAGDPGIALAAYGRLSKTELREWAVWQTARLRLEHGDEHRIEQISSSEWAETSAVTPSGLPLALLAASYVEVVPAKQRGRFAGLLRATAFRWDRGSWWLSFEERVSQRAELAQFAALAGVAPEPDARAAVLAELHKLIRSSGAGSAMWEFPSTIEWRGQTCVIPAIASPTNANRVLGAFLCGSALEQWVTRVVRPIFGILVAEIENSRSRAAIWGAALPASAPAAALPSFIGWQLRVNAPPDSASATIWYGFIGLLSALLLLGALMTGHVVRRELELVHQETDFLASVTHEFKTPITSIRLHIERLVSRRVPDPQTADAYYETIGQQAERLERLVNRMLEAHRIRSGSKQYHLVPCAPVDLVMDSLAHLRAHADARQIRVHLEAAPDIRWSGWIDSPCAKR